MLKPRRTSYKISQPSRSGGDSMKRSSYVAVLLVAIAAISSIGGAQSQGRKPPAAAPSPPPEVDAAAIAALNRMGVYLRTLKAFQVKAATSTDDVTDDGQNIESDRVTDLLALPPN